MTGEGDAAVCTVAYISRMNTRSTLLAALVFLALAPAALADRIPLADLSAYLNGLTTADTPRSPGMADRHYAPRGDVWLFSAAQRHEMADAITAWETAIKLDPQDDQIRENLQKLRSNSRK